MNSTAKRILTALWVAGAFAGLLAVIALPGRWDLGGPAEAHVLAGVEIIDTNALCDGHNLDDGDDADCDLVDHPANKGAATWLDAHPSQYLVDTNGDTVVDAISVATGTTVRVVAHSHTGTVNSPDGTDVTFTATGSAVFQAVGLDSDADGRLGDGLTPEGETGVLANITDTQTIIGQVVRDTGTAANDVDSCNAATDTCIDDAGVQDTDGTPAGTDDGIAIVEVRSGLPTSSTITGTTALGSDSVTIIWTGAVTAVSISTTRDDATDPNKTVAQTVISQAGVLGGAFKGDPDLTVTATATDSAGNPVNAVNIDCTLDTTGGGRADIGAGAAANDETFNDPIADPGGNSAFDGTTTVTGQVQTYLEAESEVGNTRGDVTITCWADTVTENDILGTGEPSATATVRVSGPPATVVLAGNTTMPIGSQTLTATVTDGDGEAVANATNCTWLLIDPLLIGGLTSPVSTGTEGTTANVSTNLLVGGGAGGVSVSVTCGDATALLSVVIGGVVFPPGDLNCDGSFTVADLLAGARALVGLDPALTAC